MSKYQFCVGCEHIVTKKVASVYWRPRDQRLVSEISCPARFNPHEPLMDTSKPKKKNKHACPRNEKFIEMENRKKEAIRGTTR